MITYKLFTIEEAIEKDYPEAEQFDGWDEADYRLGLWRCEDGVPVEFLASDGGEPEDNSFTRDGAWIPGALQAAYDLGRSEGASA